MDARKPQDTAALLLVVILGVFVLGSMTALIVGAFMGLPGGKGVWSGLFSLATATLGAIGGWIGGQQVERNRRNGNGATHVPPDQESHEGS